MNNQNNQYSVREAIQNIAVGPDRGRDITSEHAQRVMELILQGAVDEVQSAIVLIALRMKRESLEEFSGILNALRGVTQSVTAKVDHVTSLADPFDGYVRNATMTPFIAPVLAALGFNAVMHGVESVGPKHGVTAHKVYRLAGIDTQLSCEQAANVLEQVGFCYVDQSQYAPSLFAMQNLRDRMVKRTALTTLERLLLPIKGQQLNRLVLGYVHKAYPDIYARMALQAGFDHVLLLKGVEGGLAPALNKPLRRYVFDGELPEDTNAVKEVLETPYTAHAKSAACSMKEHTDQVERCLELGLAALAGKHGQARDSLSLASAQILSAFNTELSFQAAVEKVQVCLDNGEALTRFNALL